MPTCYRHPNRETGVSCRQCGRPICTDCMIPDQIGFLCPEHGRAPAAARARSSVRRLSLQGGGALVTKALVAINVLVYLAELAEGSTFRANSGSIFEHGALYGPFVANGDWWRLITAAFLHANLLHLALNMLGLWWFGAPLEAALGRWRFLLLYLVAGLAGSAGALIDQPTGVTVGASGAIFGILGAAFVLERQGHYVFGGQALMLIVLNLVFTFTVPNIAVGGHIGGLVGGALGALALSRFGRGHALYGRLGLVGIGGLLAIGIVSVVLSYWKVRGYA